MRLAALRALAGLGHWPAAPTVARRLHDTAWDVRRQAALTLRAFGPPGLIFLRRLRDSRRPGGRGGRPLRPGPRRGGSVVVNGSGRRAGSRRWPARSTPPSSIYFGLLNLCYFTLLVAAVFEMRRTRNEAVGISDHIVVGSRLAPTISILAPAYNEEATITASVQSLLTLDYPNLEVVVIADGCKDDTIGVLQREFALVEVYRAYAPRVPTKGVVALYRSLRHANLVVVDKLNGGKADALNVGLNLASGELVCAIDADTLIERGALVRLMRPMLIDPDVVATGGTIRPVNAVTTRHGSVVDVTVPRTWLAGIQVVEYLRAFLLGRLGLNRLGGNLIISGAFGLFRREPMIAAGGWLHDTVGEDMELVVRLRRLGYERGTASDVVFVPDPTAWTEVPESLGVLGRQRDRWHRGLTDTLWRHRRLIGNPRYGAMGLVVFPYFVIVELLAPIVEAAGPGAAARHRSPSAWSTAASPSCSSPSPSASA